MQFFKSLFLGVVLHSLFLRAPVFFDFIIGENGLVRDILVSNLSVESSLIPSVFSFGDRMITGRFWDLIQNIFAKVNKIDFSLSFSFCPIPSI